MQLVLSDDQTLLAEGARSFVARSCPTSRLRRLRDDATGFDVDVWRQIAELGWTRAPFAEEHGGVGLGLAGVVCITEALGRGLAAEPYLSTVLLGGLCVAAAGSAEQRAALLEPMLAGDVHLALAHQERGARFDPFQVTTCAEPTQAGFRVSGEKTQVLGGNVAHTLLVVARTSGAVSDRDGLTLLVVPREAPGVEVVRQRRVDAAPAALVRLRDVELPRAAVLGEMGGAAAILEAVVDRATAALAAEMLGSMTEALERTLQYLKERVQFGVVIGSFQALKHRAARMFIEVELCRSAVMAAARALDEGRSDARELVSVAKARANDAFLLIANEAIQMHGGIGMTDEHEIGFFLKRARAAEMTFGDSAYHRNRFAELRGF